MLSLVVFAVILLHTCTEASRASNFNPFIVGGQQADKGEYPFFVSLKSSDTYPYCGASLISPTKVLTAAHCVSDGETVKLAIGAYTKDDKINANGVAKRHESYSSSNSQNDIAVITLSEPVEGAEGFLVKLANATMGDFTGEDSTVIGLGRLKSGGSTPTNLMEVVVTTLSNEVCQEKYPREDITDDMICGAKLDKDSCQGDSGGPYMVKRDDGFYQVGVVSWGYGCADPSYPGVYSRVSHFDSWLKTQLEQ